MYHVINFDCSCLSCYFIFLLKYVWKKLFHPWCCQCKTAPVFHFFCWIFKNGNSFFCSTIFINFKSHFKEQIFKYVFVIQLILMQSFKKKIISLILWLTVEKNLPFLTSVIFFLLFFLFRLFPGATIYRNLNLAFWAVA